MIIKKIDTGGHTIQIDQQKSPATFYTATDSHGHIIASAYNLDTVADISEVSSYFDFAKKEAGRVAVLNATSGPLYLQTYRRLISGFCLIVIKQIGSGIEPEVLFATVTDIDIERRAVVGKYYGAFYYKDITTWGDVLKQVIIMPVPIAQRPTGGRLLEFKKLINRLQLYNRVAYYPIL